MDISSLITSAIRTGTPMLVGFVLSWLTAMGFQLDANTAAGLVSFLTALFGWVYYVAVRFLEMKFPKVGWLLGSPKQVTYTQTK